MQLVTRYPLLFIALVIGLSFALGKFWTRGTGSENSSTAAPPVWTREKNLPSPPKPPILAEEEHRSAIPATPPVETTGMVASPPAVDKQTEEAERNADPAQVAQRNAEESRLRALRTPTSEQKGERP
jgi:hypothetical protein